MGFPPNLSRMKVINVADGAEGFTSNAYLVLGDRNSLVDTGASPVVDEAVRENADVLDAVYITHMHDDHSGRLSSVMDAFEPELYCRADHPERTRKVEDGDVFRMGDEDFTALHTPGHAVDHLVYVSESAIFSGDVVVYSDGAFHEGSFGRTDLSPDQSRERLVSSVRKILEGLPGSVEHMYSGHGPEFHGDVRAVVEKALERAARMEPKYPDE